VLTTRRYVGAPPSRNGLRLRHVVALLVMAQLADVVTTVHALAAGNVERNPLNEWVLHHYGSVGFIVGKGLAVLVIVAALTRIPSRLAHATGLLTVVATTTAALSNARFA
jgi:hypothetical protein